MKSRSSNLQTSFADPEAWPTADLEQLAAEIEAELARRESHNDTEALEQGLRAALEAFQRRS